MNADDILAAIQKAYEDEAPRVPRRYIGASSIGNKCDAAVAFQMRGFPDDPPSPRLKRIFQLGHDLEDQAVKDLKRAGVHVMERDPLTGKQFAYSEFGGHVACHLDGLIEQGDEVLLLEVKSMNDSSWTKFQKEGIKHSHPHYYAQCNLAMLLAGLRRTFFIAYNKNISEYHIEIFERDDFEVAYVKEKVERLLGGEATKVATDETDWRCRGCFKAGVCWHDKPVETHCAVCAHSVPHESGGWWCRKHEIVAEKPCASFKRWRPKDRT